MGDILLQHLNALEQNTDENSSMRQALTEHYAKAYKVSLALVA